MGRRTGQRRTRWVLLAVALAGAASLAVAVLAGAGDGGGDLPAGPDGVAVLAGDEPEPRTVPERLNVALDAAQRLADAHPDDLGPPWADVDHDQLVLAAATDRGVALATGNAPAGVTTNVVRVPRGVATLRRVADEVLAPPGGRLPGGAALYAAHVDAPGDRVVVTAGAAPAELRRALADRYGTDAVVLRLTRSRDGGEPA